MSDDLLSVVEPRRYALFAGISGHERGGMGDHVLDFATALEAVVFANELFGLGLGAVKAADGEEFGRCNWAHIYDIVDDVVVDVPGTKASRAKLIDKLEGTSNEK